MAINEYRDKNLEKGIPQYVFWPQQLINGTWSAQPTNLIKTVKKTLPRKLPFWLEIVLVEIGLGFLVYAY